MSKVDIRLARPDDRIKLGTLQRRASLVGNADVREQLLEHPEFFDFDAELIANNQVLVAERGGRILGFATIVTHEGDDAELEGLFVEPSHWRQGIGAALLHAIEREAGAWGANRLHVVANREALGFYEAMGFEIVGETTTPLKQMVPLMAKPIRKPGT
jgi:GNAT superfamily N-acetyltransferase